MPFGHQASKLPDDVGLSSQKELLSVQLNGLSKKIQEAEDQLKTYKDLSGQNKDLQEQVIENQKELDKLYANLIVARQEIAQLQSRKELFESDSDNAEITLNVLKQSISAAQKELEGIIAKQNELVAMSLSDSKDADDKLAGKKQEISEAGQKLESVKQEIISLQKYVEEINQALTDVKTAIDSKQAELDGLDSDIEDKKSTKQSLMQDVINLTKRGNELGDQLQKVQAQIVAEQEAWKAEKSNQEKTLADREGQCSLREKWLEDKAADLTRIKGEVEKYYGKPIKINF